MAGRTKEPEVAQGVSAVGLFDDMVNLRVEPCNQLSAELALGEIPGDDGEARAAPSCRAVSPCCCVRSLRGLQWRAVRLESFRHLLSTPA
jgi:hypothetical protein